MKTKIYTGIGSRRTPREILELMVRFGAIMAKQGAILRSGGADGADAAFERGCDSENGQKQIFLPWKGFNKNPSIYHKPKSEAYDIAARIHPAWVNCNHAARSLHARNTHQVLGPNLDEPSNAVFFWSEEDEHGEIFGGTRTAVKLAQEHGVVCVNLYRPNGLEVIQECIERYAT